MTTGAGTNSATNDTAVDREFVLRVQAGDKAAFDFLVSKYQFKISHLVARYVASQGDIDDVVQETFVKAYRAIGSFRGDSAFYTWIYRIAINTAKNYLVAQSRRPPAADVDIGDAEVGEAGRVFRDVASPEHMAMTTELKNRLNETLLALPEELREAIRLREFEGLSYEEIAEAMQCPIGTVRSRIFRARDAIEKALKPLLD